MELLSVFAAASGLLAVIVGLLQAVYTFRSQEETKEALIAAREPRIDQALHQGDLKALGEYFFNTLGRLPLSEYTDDSEAHRVVSGAVRNVENFIKADQSSVAEDADALSQIDADRVEADLAMGDIWGGLSRLRRLIETSLRSVATEADIPAGRIGPTQLLKRLVDAELVDQGAANSLRRAIDICNRGVHGELVSGEEVEEAQMRAAVGLAGLKPQGPAAG